MKLKYRLIFTITALNAFLVSVVSQPIFGFQAGINVSALSGSKSYTENKLRLGLHAYVFTDIQLGHKSIVSVETGLALSQQGMNHVKNIKEIGLSEEYKVYNNLSYVVLPIYLKENYSNFYTKIGPYGAYLLKAQSKWTSNKTIGSVKQPGTSGFDEEFANNVNKYDMGLSFGFGYIHYFDPQIYRNKRHRNRQTPVMQVDFKYNMGLMPLDPSKNIPSLNLKNHVFTLALSFTSVKN